MLQCDHSTEVTKDKLFQTLMSWKSEVDLAMKKVRFTDPSGVEAVVSEWQYNTRCQDRVLKPPGKGFHCN